MAWNPYLDQKNRAFSGILTFLFPEQTKTIPRILVWSVIFLADLILVIGAAFQLGLLDAFSRVTYLLLVFICVGLFWLQGKIWGAVTKLFSKEEVIS